jgi:hypothetical protein
MREKTRISSFKVNDESAWRLSWPQCSKHTLHSTRFKWPRSICIHTGLELKRSFVCVDVVRQFPRLREWIRNGGAHSTHLSIRIVNGMNRFHRAGRGETARCHWKSWPTSKLSLFHHLSAAGRITLHIHTHTHTTSGPNHLHTVRGDYFLQADALGPCHQ